MGDLFESAAAALKPQPHLSMTAGDTAEQAKDDASVRAVGPDMFLVGGRRDPIAESTDQRRRGAFHRGRGLSLFLSACDHGAYPRAAHQCRARQGAGPWPYECICKCR